MLTRWRILTFFISLGIEKATLELLSDTVQSKWLGSLVCAAVHV